MLTTNEVVAMLEENLTGAKVTCCEKFFEQLNHRVAVEKYWKITYRRKLYEHTVVSFIINDMLYLYPFMAKDTITSEIIEQITYASFPLSAHASKERLLFS